MCISDGTTPHSNWYTDPAIDLLVRRKAHELTTSPGFGTSDLRDLMQELLLHLHRKFKHFDPARAKPATFASRLIESKAASMLRAQRAQKRRGPSADVSLSASVDNRVGKTVELGSTIPDSAARRHTGQRRRSESELAQLRTDVAEINRALRPELKDLAALLGHVSQYAAAEVLGISRRQAANRVTELRTLYEDHGLNL